MCFSATASFTVAAIAAGIGVAALRGNKSPSQAPFAAIPILFAAQQAAEGGLWLALSHGEPGNWPSILTQLYLSFALVIWPVYTPAAAFLMEPVTWRRGVMFGCGLCGVAVAAFFLVQLLTLHNEGYISGHHILYRTQVEAPLFAGTVYLTATTLALVMSSHRTLEVFGGIVFAAAVLTYVFAPDAFVSVWCFYASAASITVLVHFRQQILRGA
jgi:hypothetical protein